MWIAFIAGYVVGSVSLYAYMVATAKEPQKDECMDCTLTECTDCPYAATTSVPAINRRAA